MKTDWKILIGQSIGYWLILMSILMTILMTINPPFGPDCKENENQLTSNWSH